MKSSLFFAVKHLMVGSWYLFNYCLLDANNSSDFNDHQRDVFCVFSGAGVNRLREYLNQEANVNYDIEGTMYDDSNNDDGENNVFVVPPPPPAPPVPHSTQQPGQSVLQIESMHDFPALPPPPPPAPQLQQQPFSQHPQQHNLPPLQIPQRPQTGGTESPNAMSPTHDAPLTLDDEDFSDSDIIMGPEPAPAPAPTPVP
jgi:hypothetical protein